MTRPGRLLRPEDDPGFQARRQQADLAAEAVRRSAAWKALGWFCGFQLSGALLGFASFHPTNLELARAMLLGAYLIGNGGGLLAVWLVYFRRERRGDW